ncbi:DUF559 domain-containing protein [Gordonia sp. NPDC003429]
MLDVGVYTWAELTRNGMTQSELRRALAAGDCLRLRRGWYATRTADPLAVEAVRNGGALSCVSALSKYGVWIPPGLGELHIRGCSQSHRRWPSRFCRQFGRPESVHHAVDDPLTALRHAIRCLDHEGVIVVCDSMLNRRRRYDRGRLRSVDESLVPTAADIRSVFDGAPRSLVTCLDRCDDRSMSGTETMVRERLRSRGIAVRVQVHIPGLGHVDLVVGDRLVVEVDSVAHHTGEVNYTEDRRRDRAAARQGYLRMPFTYEDVVYRWRETEQDILYAVHNGHHRNRRRRGDCAR